MNPNSVLELIEVEAYQKWQQHIIYEKNRAQPYDSQPSNSTLEKDINPTNMQPDDSGSELQNQVKSRQQELISAVIAGPAKCSRYILKQLCVTDEVELRAAVPTLPNPITAAELKQLPRYAEEYLAKSLANILPHEAATPAFWTACHAIWIKQKNFDDLVVSFLEGLRDNDDEAKTRNFLRRTGGLERVRGKVSVLVDCPISMAWWRVRFAHEITSMIPSKILDFSTAHELLHDRTIWEELTGLSVKRLTALNAPKARAVAIVALAQRGSISNGITTALRKAHCQGALLAIARLSHSFSLNTIPWNQLLQAAKAGIEEADNNHLSTN